MKNQRKKIYRLIIYAVLFLLLSSYGCTENKKTAHPKPNIILIVTDDQDAGSVKYMNKMQEKVISKGITFTNAFVTSSWCAPSRGSILTGQYPRNSKVISGYEQLHGKVEKKTIAPLLKKAGYRNVFVGKYINRYGISHPHYIPEGWDDWNALTIENKYYNYAMNENGKIVQYGDKENDYVSDIISAKSIDALDRKDDSTPFFMFINTVSPHNPNIPAKKYKNECKDIEKVSFNFEVDLGDKPEWVRSYTQLNTDLIEKYFGNKQIMNSLMRNRCKTLQSVDEMIDSIVTKLEQTDRLDNTYIFIISDNGDGLTKHIPVSAKLSPYEEGIRVPFFASGPGIPANKNITHLVSTVDILPTLADIAGITSYNNIDGRSLLPLLNENPIPEDKWRDAVFAELVTHLGSFWPWKSSPPAYMVMRAKDFKYIEYKTGEREYYDLINDPDEMNNIYKELKPEKQKYLSARLKEISKGGKKNKGLF